MTIDYTFGQRPFTYTPPTGFVALNTFNLPTPTIGATASTQAGDYFNAVLWTGDGTGSRAITGVGFQPDLVWVKPRSIVESHLLNDSVRGVGDGSNARILTSNNTEAENWHSPAFGYLSAFSSDGFSTTAGSTSNGRYNGSGVTYVGWNWKANGAGVTNTAGSITSTVSANTSAGFSVVTYTGTGANATVGHGLGVAPRMIIVKNRDAADAWQVYHAANTANPETDYLVLNTTAATADAADRWNDTLPTSTVFSIGNGVEVNTNTEKYVAYCFSEVAGYSAFGSYTGNGSTDGVFVYCGFLPRWIMIKRTDTTGMNWGIWDTAQNTYNVELLSLYANSSSAQINASDLSLDGVSNGFKIRGNSLGINASGGTYIFMAFAETPLNFALAR
jgi:hypothetical protein